MWLTWRFAHSNFGRLVDNDNLKTHVVNLLAVDVIVHDCDDKKHGMKCNENFEYRSRKLIFEYVLFKLVVSLATYNPSALFVKFWKTCTFILSKKFGRYDFSENLNQTEIMTS